MPDIEPRDRPGRRPQATRPGRAHRAAGTRHPRGRPVAALPWGEVLRRHRYRILLATLVCALLVQSIDRRPVGLTLITELIVGLSAVAVALAVFDNRKSRLFSLWLGGTVAALGWARYALPDTAYHWLDLVHRPLMVPFFGWATAVILRDVFKQERIGTDDVIGAVSGYLLAAAAWASLYISWETLYPGSFQISPPLAAHFSDWHGRTALFNYFSLATLTSIGYGDVVPIRGPMTAVAMLETVFGQFYIAVVVAQLVGMRLAQGPRGRGGG